MAAAFAFPELAIQLRHERHVVQARQQARELAALLGFENQDQIRLATAASELARNAFRYAVNGLVEFMVRGTPQRFVICVSDKGKGIANLPDILAGRYVSSTGLGHGLIGTKRLMDYFSVTTDASGTRVECGKSLPVSASRVSATLAKSFATHLETRLAANSTDPFDEIGKQNRDLLKTLAELKEKQEQLAELNRELEDTNRGVVALYAELEQHADDLRNISDLKTRFLANLSHEFRTPLNSIESLSRLLLGRFDGELTEEQEKQVQYMQRSAAALNEMVNDLLDLAKVEAGKIDIKPKHFEIHEFLSGMRGMLKPLLMSDNVALVFEAAPELTTVYLDEGKLSQILRNLISNALKFTREGHIQVTAEAGAPGWIVFCVADTGIGIAPEDQPRVFQEFVQIDGEFQKESKGTGLGLPLSRKLAEVLGGTLELESELGSGSTFTLRLPATLGKPIDPKVSVSAPVEPVTATILFIEDNRETRFIHERAVKSGGFRSLFVANIPDAREVMKTVVPELIVLDRYLADKDSLYFLNEVKASGYRGPSIVVSIIDDAESALAAGATRFLHKPIPPLVLLTAVSELIRGAPSRTILLVDDDEVTRYLVGSELTKHGFRILEAHSGREALLSIEKEAPDGVILDISMPGISGYDVLRQIRASAGTRALPVIIHSSREFTVEERQLLSDLNAFIYPKQAFKSKSGATGLLQVLRTAGLQT